MTELDVETFAAATLILNVGIIELKALIQAFLNKIDLSAIQIKQDSLDQ